MQYRLFIHNTLQDVSQIALEYFGKISLSLNFADNQLVTTSAVQAVSKYIIDEIINNYPAYNRINALGEITDEHADFTWVIQPISGENNFVHSVPQFGIMIGLLNKNKPFAGGISLPYYSKIISAEKNEGAFCNGERVYVSKETKLLNTLIAYNIENQESIRNDVKKISEPLLGISNLRISAIAYDITLVAQSNYGGFLNKSSKIWENVAPQIIIEEASGKYTDYYGKDIDYANVLENISQNYTCCAASPVLHKQLQSIIHTK